MLASSAVVVLVGFAAWKVFASENHRSLNDFLVPEAFFPSCEVSRGFNNRAYQC